MHNKSTIIRANETLDMVFNTKMLAALERDISLSLRGMGNHVFATCIIYEPMEVFIVKIKDHREVKDALRTR